MVRLRADGTGETDYGASTVYTAVGVAAEQEMSGVVRFRYAVANGSISYSDVSSAATYVHRSAYGVPISGRAMPVLDPVTYTCDGDVMKTRNAVYSVELSRVSRSA